MGKPFGDDGSSFHGMLHALFCPETHTHEECPNYEQGEHKKVDEDLVFRLRERARIRRSIDNRKSVQLGEPDRICELLEEAAQTIERMRAAVPVADRPEAPSAASCLSYGEGEPPCGCDGECERVARGLFDFEIKGSSAIEKEFMEAEQ